MGLAKDGRWWWSTADRIAAEGAATETYRPSSLEGNVFIIWDLEKRGPCHSVVFKEKERYMMIEAQALPASLA